MYTQIARAVTRPGGALANIEEFNTSAPDLMIVTLMKDSEKFLKSNCVYTLVYNELSDTIELKEVGEANIGKYWGRAYYDIETYLGKARTWFSKEEYENISEENKKGS